MSHTLDWEYFVWVKHNGKVWPQVWGSDLSDRIEVRLGMVVAKHKLTIEDQPLGLEELKKKYPAPEINDAL